VIISVGADLCVCPFALYTIARANTWVRPYVTAPAVPFAHPANSLIDLHQLPHHANIFVTDAEIVNTGGNRKR